MAGGPARTQALLGQLPMNSPSHGHRLRSWGGGGGGR